MNGLDYALTILAALTLTTQFMYAAWMAYREGGTE